MQSLKKNWFVVSNIYDMKNLVNLHPTIQKSKNFTRMGYFCPTYRRFELKKYRRVIFHDTKQWWKIWKTLILWFQKWHEVLGDLSSSENPKVWKLYIDGLFLSKVYTVSVRNFQKNYLSWHWRVFKCNLTCRLKNDIRNLVNFHVSGWKPENLNFHWIRLSKAYKYLDKKVQKSYVPWHWRVMQGLKKNWLLVRKMTWGTWWILMQAVVSLEICTLMGYFCQ